MLAALAGLLLAQPIVRQLDVVGEVTRDAQVIAANERSIWFTAGEATSSRRGGDRVFRFDRDGGAVEPVISGNDWSGTDLHLDNPGSMVRVGGHARGAFLFTKDGEFGPRGAATMRYPFPRVVIPSGPVVVWMSDDHLSWFSSTPGEARRLEAPLLVGPWASTNDGRVAWNGRTDAGALVTVLVLPDAGVLVDPSRFIAGSVGQTFLFSTRDGGLVNEAGEWLAQARPSGFLRPSAGVPRFSGERGELVVTDGTRAGTRTVTGPPLASWLQVTLAFATFRLADGGGGLVNFSDGTTVLLPRPVLVGEETEESVIDGNLELFADGGIARRANVANCDWRRFGSRELLCFSEEGALLSRATPDAPQRELLAPAIRGRATGLSRALPPLVEGAPLLLTSPFPMWTDGVVARSLEQEGTVLGQSRGQIVLPIDGVTLLEPTTGARRALGLPSGWRAHPSLRELFIDQPTDAGCSLRRLNARGEFVEVEPTCLRELVDVPGGVIGRSSTLEWLAWEPTKARFVMLEVPRSGFLQAAVSSSVHFGAGEFASDGTTFEDFSPNTVVDLATGVARTFEPGARVAVTPLGLVWTPKSRTTVTFEAKSGQVFEVDAAGRFRATWSSKALWLLTGSSVLVSTGGPLEVVSSEPMTWWNSAAVGEVLFIRTERELVTLSREGETRRFPFVEARQSFGAGDTRWLSLDDGVHGFEPWLFDGQTLSLMADLKPGPASSDPHFLGLARGRVVLEAGRPDGTIGLTSIEYQALPPDPSVPMPEPGCQGCSGVPVAESLSLALLLLRRRRR